MAGVTVVFPFSAVVLTSVLAVCMPGLFLRPKPETSGGGSPRFAFGGKSKFYEVHLGFMYANVILYGERL